MVSRKQHKQQLAQLREQAAKRQKDVSRKIARHEKAGVKLIGSVHDPRGDMARVARYNQRQLEAHINRLDEFMNRRTQFVPGVKGTPISKQVWTNYQRAEAKRNKAEAQRYEQIKNMRLPGRMLNDGSMEPGITIDQRQEGLPGRKSAYGVTDIPHRPVFRMSRNFTDEQAMKILTLDMLNRARPQWIAERAAKEQANWLKMDAGQHQPDMVEAISQLTPFQFDVMWNYTSFATAASSEYEGARKLLNIEEQETSEQIVNARKEMWKYIGWAKEINLGS
jgi:hypothetical protein